MVDGQLAEHIALHACIVGLISATILTSIKAVTGQINANSSNRFRGVKAERRKATLNYGDEKC